MELASWVTPVFKLLFHAEVAAGKKVYVVVDLHMYNFTGGFSSDSFGSAQLGVGGSVMAPRQSVSVLFQLFVSKNLVISTVRTPVRKNKELNSPQWRE